MVSGFRRSRSQLRREWPTLLVLLALLLVIGYIALSARSCRARGGVAVTGIFTIACVEPRR